ncbi:S10 family peptidase [Burkholderia plantarii]|uniref:Serine carboxypeptidase family protein n=1 Tax=Burkholderia plantarii TaxID=41899 RepID=A0A0B6S570_BURPL|nr:peptidase S10 [Burkholderia plantarii]AJK48455.1 serine carboxypeptidase family protein [Burkholderia plantarii]
MSFRLNVVSRRLSWLVAILAVTAGPGSAFAADSTGPAPASAASAAKAGEPARASGATPPALARPAPATAPPSQADATHRAASPDARRPDDAHPAQNDAAFVPVPPETASVTRHSIRLDGRTLDYTATAGNLLLRDDAGQATASVFYVAYTAHGRRPGERPVTFLFNGGPGAGSVFLMMGSFGPKRARTASPAVSGPAPYDLADNPDSLLGQTDLVFIDAVGAGFSRTVGHATGKAFWSVDGDLDAFDHFIERYLTVNQRWNSPKYLLGESYGTARAAMLAYRLNQSNIALNGVILMSSVLDSAAFSPGSDFESESYLPTFAAIAWYHDRLRPKPPSLPAFLDEVRAFARGPYEQALAQGDALPDAERDAIAARLAQYTGIDAQYIKEARLRLGPTRFRKQLLRGESRSLGRYDARFEGIDYDDAGEHPDFDASAASISSVFDAALHQHLANDLDYRPADRYRVFNDAALVQWDWKHREWWGERLAVPYAAGDLAEAMRQNPKLRVMSLNGYFDLATPFYATEYALSHLGVERSLRANVEIHHYPTGHMIYLDDAALHAMKVDLARFYQGEPRTN